MNVVIETCILMLSAVSSQSFVTLFLLLLRSQSISVNPGWLLVISSSTWVAPGSMISSLVWFVL